MFSRSLHNYRIRPYRKGARSQQVRQELCLLEPDAVLGIRPVDRKGGRTVLQADETAPEDKILLGNEPQCGQGPDLLCDHCLLSGGSSGQQIEFRAEYLRNITDIEYFATRQNPCKRDIYGLRLQRCQRTKI